MAWLIKFFSSSIGQKLIMSLTGLFLCSFLVVHCLGNTLIFKDDQGAAFNAYGEFMSKNPVIKTIAYGLYAMIIVHTFKGIALYLHNRKSRGTGYAVSTRANSNWYSKQMAILGSIIFIFIGVHMSHFWYSVQIGALSTDSHGHEDLYTAVAEAFKVEWIVIFYVLSQAVLAFHLLHGFQSAFQTLGLNHKKYTPLIKGLGAAFSIVIPALFAAMPLYIYFVK